MKSKTLDNTIYMIKNWIAWDKKSLIYFIIKVPAQVLNPILTAYIPKAMIDCINNRVSIGELAATVALLSALVAVTTWLAPFMQELLFGSERIIRMRYAVMAFNKNLNADYIQLESLEELPQLPKVQMNLDEDLFVEEREQPADEMAENEGM